ncbi:hypothetical protein ACLI09_11215 [Flavobacterium sp. RHBU_24]|uniref:hypothetical protein n=1 Tax=Flavobacterium sp. RHBU_24 TaxID=3391185 RepID=UPI003984F8E8
MKRLLILIATCFLTLSCETEETAVSNVPQDNLVTNSALKGKLLRVLQSPTTVDNFIDGSGCFAVQFPYTVVANGQQVNLTSEADYAEVYSILNANGSNADVVTLQFPVTVTYADYTEATLNTQAQFDAAVSNCTESTELSCMDFTYPVGIKTYNSSYQLAESFDISTKEALYGFLNTLETYDAVVFDYPVVFNVPDAGAVAAADNQALEQQIDMYAPQCGSAVSPPVVLEEVLVQDTWYVSYYFSITDQTSDYQGYGFTFANDNTIAVNAGTPSFGIWAVNEIDGQTKLGLAFIDPALAAIGPMQAWTVTGLTDTEIVLHIDSTGTEPERYLTLTKN